MGGGYSRKAYQTKKKLAVTYHDIISPENLLEAWQEFLRGKRNKPDVQEFEAHLMDNLFSLHEDLKNKTYAHGGYHAFKINDPKPRDIHKATVRDRLLHHALYRILYPFFDTLFIADSYSCRKDKGTHKAFHRFQYFSRKVSCNHTKTAWVLKCDVHYADDFVFFSRNYEELEGWLISIKEFLWERLHLKLHPDKVFFKTVASGVDFLGWIHFSDHRVLRTATKRRMLRRISKRNMDSYLGMLSHGDGYSLQKKLQEHLDSLVE